MKILIASTSAPGHLNPLLSIASLLVESLFSFTYDDVAGPRHRNSGTAIFGYFTGLGTANAENLRPGHLGETSTIVTPE
jgi:hypothetical protein